MDASNVLDSIRDVLLEHMSDPNEWQLDWCRIERIVHVGKSGRLLALDQLCDGDPPVALLVMMGNGAEYRLTLTPAIADRS